MADSEKSGGGKKKILLIVLPVLVVGLAAGWFLFGGGGGDAEATPEPEPEPVVEGEVIEVGTMTVNLADPGELRYGRITLAVVLAADADSGVVGKRIPLVKDAALDVLSGYTAAEILAPDALDELREALTARAQEIYPDGEVLRVVITELIVQ